MAPNRLSSSSRTREPSAIPRELRRTIGDIRLNARIRRLPASQVDAQLPKCLALVTRSRNMNFKLMRTALFRHALGSPQEILQAPEGLGMAEENVQGRRGDPELPQPAAIRSVMG